MLYSDDGHKTDQVFDRRFEWKWLSLEINANKFWFLIPFWKYETKNNVFFEYDLCEKN